mmetsp:Transcript_5008/g.17707  ORF Transcript_5008/g.17707 Transcript_5008/m.17707 type:complete len:287 (-) Transcript_5008:3883-4743(-)
MTSLPWRWKPRSWSNDAIWSTETSVNGVASPSLPVSAPTLDCRHSTRCPTVMREGMACGLTMISGVMPSRVQGMSSCRYVMPIVPFWPKTLCEWPRSNSALGESTPAGAPRATKERPSAPGAPRTSSDGGIAPGCSVRYGPGSFQMAALQPSGWPPCNHGLGASKPRASAKTRQPAGSRANRQAASTSGGPKRRSLGLGRLDTSFGQCPLDSALCKGDGPSVTVASTAAPKTAPWTVTRPQRQRLRRRLDGPEGRSPKTGPSLKPYFEQQSDPDVFKARLWRGTLP